MEQQEYVNSQVAKADDSPDILSRWLLDLEVQVVDFLSNYRVPGVLEGFAPGEVGILLKEPLCEQRAVTVHLQSFVFEGQTLCCRPRQDQYETHISIDDVEQIGLRRAPRFPVKLSAQLFLPHASPLAITILDISSDGLGIELPVPVETGQPIAIATGSIFVFAVVRHCRQVSASLFRAGIEMHHLFEKGIEPPASSPRSTFLRRVWRRRGS